MIDLKREQGYIFTIETHKVNGKAYSYLYPQKGRAANFLVLNSKFDSVVADDNKTVSHLN